MAVNLERLAKRPGLPQHLLVTLNRQTHPCNCSLKLADRFKSTRLREGSWTWRHRIHTKSRTLEAPWAKQFSQRIILQA